MPNTNPVAATQPTVNFNAHHSPMGAFFSFTCGHFGTRGGIAAERGRPANQDVYVGVKDGDRLSSNSMRCLPFYEGADKGAQAVMPDVAAQSFLVEQMKDPDLADPDADKKRPRVTAYAANQIQRDYQWSTDRWTTPDFQFDVYTPFGEIPDPQTAAASELRKALLPAVTARLIIDNTKGQETKTGFFSLGFHESGVRIIDEGLHGANQRIGFAMKNHMGVAAELLDTTPAGKTPPSSAPATKPASTTTSASPANKPALFAFMRWSPNDGIADPNNPVHLLGSCPGVGFEVPAGRRCELVIALGCYLDGVVTTRLEMRYLYTRHFANLNDVLDEALNRADALRAEASANDKELAASRMSDDQKFLMAHATRSYYGSTQLLELAGQPFWVVNEGEYCMLNTLDLSVDHVFWELQHNPWVIRNLLDNFVRYYSYHDQVKDPKTGALYPGGISFAHDQGVHNNFSPLERSSYELTALKGCFSHMTAEQLCNWTLIAACYVAKTNDLAWLHRQEPTINACYLSMLHRDHFDPEKRTGIMQLDSTRCGSDGWEITTYDSLDESLGQARNNLYLGVKGWATYLGLELMFSKLDNRFGAEQAKASAELAAKTIAHQMRPEGFIPAVFEPGNKGYDSRILPAIEGLVYPLYFNACHSQTPASTYPFNTPGPNADMLAALRQHTETLLADPESRNRFADQGLKLSSSSNNSWMSKIAIYQHVSRVLWGIEKADIHQAQADRAHVRWQTENSSAYWAMSDQMVKGIAIGSKYYPRCVTMVLWMGE